MTNELADAELVLQDNDDLDNIIGAPPEDLSDEEIVNKDIKNVPYKKLSEKNSAGRLQMRVPDAPDNLIELVYQKKCVDCSAILTTICSALMHYNSVKHQNKIALKFLPHGTYNLPLSKEEIREIETGSAKASETKASKVPFKEIVKKYEIEEDVRKLDLQFCRLCETPFSSKVAALQHYSGKKHKKKAENWSPFNPVQAIDTKDDQKCDVCNVICESVMHMESHLAGRKHKIKMKAYLERMNAGVFAPPMSSRGFCDFNNVEREEMNPIDPSSFVVEKILPKNLGGSFLDKFESVDGLRSYAAGRPEEVEEEERLREENNRFGVRGYCDRFENPHSDMMRRDHRSIFDDYHEDIKPIVPPPVSSFTPNMYSPDFQRRSFNEVADYDYHGTNSLRRHGSLHDPEFNSPYAPRFTNKVPFRNSVKSFGPTKFRYNSHGQL